MEELTIIQSVFYVVALSLVIFSAYRFRRYKNLNSWAEVPATINKIRESSSFIFQHPWSNVSLDVYYPEVNYSYFYQEEKYESQRVSLNLSNIWIFMASNEVTGRYNHRFWCTWKKGLKVNAFVNPENPKKSVLIKQMSKNYKSTSITLIATGILIAMFSYYGLPYIASNLI